MPQIKVFKFNAANKKYEEQITQEVSDEVYNKIKTTLHPDQLMTDVKAYQYAVYNLDVFEFSFFSYTPLDLIIHKLNEKHSDKTAQQ